MQGFIDYTLAKRSVLEGFRRGMVRRLDICDAHPELMRAAKNIGVKTLQPCPVCAGNTLRLVRYVYGDQLKHLSGRPVYPDGWDISLSQKVDEFRCYSIEVCVECAWNHLAACFLMGRKYNTEAAPARSKKRRSSGH